MILATRKTGRAKADMPKDPRSTINDDDWQNLRDRADKANPDMWRVTDPKGMEARKRANANFENRDKN